MPDDAVEKAIEQYYNVVALPASQLDDIQQTLTQAFNHEHEQADRIRSRTEHRLDRLNEQRHRLMQALYVDAVPLDLFKTEQERIRNEERQLKMHLEAIDANFDDIRANLERAVQLARDAAAAYRAAPPHLRRQWNQLLFTHLYVDDTGVVGSELTPPFAALLADDLIERLNSELNHTPPDETPDDDQLSFVRSGTVTGVCPVQWGSHCPLRVMSGAVVLRRSGRLQRRMVDQPILRGEGVAKRRIHDQWFLVAPRAEMLPGFVVV